MRPRKISTTYSKVEGTQGLHDRGGGVTDTTGSQALNEALSEKRADAVVHYLQMNEVPLRRILAPAGLGESHGVADNDTSAGRKLNRRVEVKVLVSKAIEGPISAINSRRPRRLALNLIKYCRFTQ